MVISPTPNNPTHIPSPTLCNSLSLKNPHWDVPLPMHLEAVKVEMVISKDQTVRLEQNTIHRYFRQQHQINFDTVTIKMTIPPPQPVKVSKRASKISQQSAKVMTSIANGIDDEGLKEQLISLARQDNSN